MRCRSPLKDISRSICQRILRRDRFWISFGYLATWNDCNKQQKDHWMLCNSPQAEHETCDASGHYWTFTLFADSHFTLILTKMTSGICDNPAGRVNDAKLYQAVFQFQRGNLCADGCGDRAAGAPDARLRRIRRYRRRNVRQRADSCFRSIGHRSRRGRDRYAAIVETRAECGRAGARAKAAKRDSGICRNPEAKTGKTTKKKKKRR